jgi:cysteine synthase A
MKIYNNILETIGKTPIVKINNLNEGSANIFAKVEYFNPAGSIKDRAALSMIEEAEKQGLIKAGETTIIEPTSGNTGIGLALVCLLKGYKLILTMPDTMSKERRDILKAYGAELVLTDGTKGMTASIEEAQKLNKEIQNSFIPQQFNNPANTKVHYEITAEEIWNDTDGKVDMVVAGVGTGGTISGIARKLKEKNPNIKAIAVEPYSSPVITQGKAGLHQIQGIGANFIPENYDATVIDEVLTVTNEDAVKTAKELANKEGIFVGISSGAALSAAIEISNREENKDKLIVVILPDTGMRYLSSVMFQD